MNTFDYQANALNAMHGVLGAAFAAVVITVLIVELLIKGFALWHAARNRQTYWFIALLVVHTVGILDAIYLIWFREDKNTLAVPPPPATPPATISSAA